jgi:HSP20 family protein
MNTNANETASATAPAPDQSRSLQSFVPPQVNIYETKTGYALEADLPGVNKEGLDIAVDATTLTISGRRVKPTLSAEPIYRESITADYRRVFELDPEIDTAGITAKLEQGVLTVTLPKTERAKPRKIAVGE